MTVTIHSTDLAPVLRTAAAAIERRNPIPILGMLRLTAAAGADVATVTATDLDIEIATEVPASAEADLDIAVAPSRLAMACAGYRGDVRLSLSREGQAEILTIAAADMTQRVRSILPSTEFPVMRRAEGDGFDLAEADLWAALHNTLPCVSTEETRYYLNGVYLDAMKGCAVATDGWRLARYDLIGIAPMQAGAILPTKAAKLLLGLLRRDGNRLVCAQFAMSERRKDKSSDPEPWPDRMTFTVGDAQITTKIIDGTYPDWTRVIPAPSDAISVAVSRAAVQQVTALCDLDEPIAISPETGKLTVKTADGDLTEVSGQPGQGERFSLKARYLRDILGRHDPARLSGKDANHPLMVATEDPRLLHVFMPMLLD
ncbi:MAG: DNA polymerase III subunit beta [Rhodobacteraceae bacterium]|jgi:DNA polymerase-3 subunit beta|nr:DNA polymerase III subunit beta [Paracoccaceae bacterium]